MSITFEQIIANRNLLLTTTRPELKVLLANQTTEKITLLIKRLADIEWLTQNASRDIVINVTLALPAQTDLNSLNLFIVAASKSNISPPDDPDLFFLENRPLLEKMVGKENEQKTKIHLLKGALENKAHRSSAILIEELFNEDYPDLLTTISCAYSTTKEVCLYFKLFKEKYGSEALKKKIDEKYRYLWDPACSFETEPVMAILDFLKEENIDPAPFIRENWIINTHKLKCIDVLLSAVTSADKIKILEEHAGEIFFKLLKDSAENCETFLNQVKELGISLCKVLSFRSNFEPLTALDYSCLHGGPEHLKVILKYIDDELLWEQLHTTNHGLRTPFQHCVYYHPESGSKEILDEAYEKLKGRRDTK